MSSNLKDLEVHVPLRNLYACETGKYINVYQYKRIIVTFFCDVALNLIFTFSHDSVREGPKQVFTSTPGVWEITSIDIALPYLKLEYERSNPDDNTISNDLVVVCNGHLKRGFTMMESSDAKDDKKKRRWSFLNKASETSGTSNSSSHKDSEEIQIQRLPPSLPKNDSRIPELILPNTLFVGGKGNKIVALPPGQLGQILQYTDQGIKWV